MASGNGFSERDLVATDGFNLSLNHNMNKERQDYEFK